MPDENETKCSSTLEVDNFNATKSSLKLATNKMIKDEEYNPFKNRNLEHPNSYSGALAHVLKSCVGTGILALPSAVRSVGIVIGVLGTVLIGILCTHTVHLLIWASQTMCKKARVPTLDFSETAYEVFKCGPKKVQSWANFARTFVDTALLIGGFGNAVYVVFVCESIQDLFTYHFPSTTDWPLQYYMLMILLPLILCCQFRQLKHLVPFSIIANITIIMAFGITLYYMFAGIKDIVLQDRKLFNDMTSFPLYFSTVLFAMQGIGNMLPIENTMTQPRFIGGCGVLNLATCIIICLYTVFGFFGYIRFGEHVGANVIGNLPNKEVPAQVAKGCIATSVFFTIMLAFHVPCDIMWNKTSSRISKERQNFAQTVLRTVLVLITVAIAAAVPKLDTIISLTGSVFLSILGLFIPVVIDTVLNMSENGNFGFLKWRLWKNILIGILAWFALVFGSYYAILDLIKDKK